MNPSDPVVITVARGNDIVMEAEGTRTKVNIMDSRSGRVLCSRLDIEYMTINMPFIGIQAGED